MGRLIEGQWSTQWYDPDDDGRFVRPSTVFRDRIEAGGRFAPEAGRYHLYVSLACPWAHRTLIARVLKGLDDVISVTVVDPYMGDDGWTFQDDDPDPIHGHTFLREVYTSADSAYTGRVTVPALWDRQEGTIVNNESREILRMLDHGFAGLATRDLDLCPPDLHDEVERILDAIYEPINNGVYRAGFAETQQAYDEAVGEVFEALDQWDAHLADHRYLCGSRMTEADICLFTTLLRFDPVYVSHFKCNVRRIADYPHLSGYLRDIYQTPGVAATCSIAHIKEHYFRSHPFINPTRIVPVGPALDLDAPHGRA
ncbi:MAG: glutathione S-transferase family protein [Deltaproteobacteria bacterium]|nr:MAG: glutathione S-transferase family protein [Deltaproteobacteria bacterium]